MPKKNKYVDFVSDEHFLNCIKWVCDGYTSKKDINKNVLDIFKTIFDLINHKTDYNNWLKGEEVRQTDKTVTNKIGEFHQKLLGGVKGWEDLDKGHKLEIDLKNDNNTIFIELKNKHNTVTKTRLKNVFDTLKKVIDKYPKSIAYYAYIIPAKPGSGEKTWKTTKRKPNDKIKEAWGARVYEIVTEDKNALEKTWKALPKAIEQVLWQKSQISQQDIQRLSELFQKIFQQ